MLISSALVVLSHTGCLWITGVFHSSLASQFFREIFSLNDVLKYRQVLKP